MVVKRRIYKVISIFAIACLVAVLFSCSSPVRRIDVTSTYNGLNRLEEGEIDIDRLNDWIYIEGNPYHDRECAVSVHDGILHVSEIDDDANRRYMFIGDNGYFLGVNIGEFDGWVRYYPFNSATLSLESKLICENNCVGMVKCNNREGYFVVYDIESEDQKGTIYKLTLPDTDSKWECRQVAIVEGIPQCMGYDEERKELIVASDKGLYLINVTDGDLSPVSLTVPSQDVWSVIQPNSIAALDEFIYVGTSTGVYEYDRNTSEYHWYPVDYSAYS